MNLVGYVQVIAAITANDIQCFLRDRPALFWTFAGPLLCILFFGYLTQPNVPPPPVIRIADHDGGTVSQFLADSMRADGYRVEIGGTADESKEWLVEVGKGAGAALNSNGVVPLTLHAEAQPSERERSVRFELERAVAQSRVALYSKGRELSPIRITQQDPGFKPHFITRGYQRSVPAYLLMFLTLTVLVAGANLSDDRAAGRLRRIYTTSVSRGQLIAAKLLARLLVGYLQALILFGIGIVVLRITFAEHPGVLFSFLSVYVLAIAAVGIVIGSAFQDPDQAQTFAIWLSIIAAALSGMWWPRELLSPPLQLIAVVLPTGWAVAALNSLLAFGADWSEIAGPLAALLVIFVGCFALSVRRLSA